MKLKHYVCTRLWQGKNSKRWLDLRIQQAKDTLLYSLENQTNKNFEIIIITDLESIDYLQSSLGNNYTYCIRGEKIGVTPVCQYIYVTRIDSDDIFHPEAVNDIQTAHVPNGITALVNEKGYKYNPITNRMSKMSSPISQFQTIIYKREEWEQLDFMGFFDHTEIKKRHKTKALPPWKFIWQAHSHNISSPIIGKGNNSHKDLGKLPSKQIKSILENFKITRKKFLFSFRQDKMLYNNYNHCKNKLIPHNEEQRYEQLVKNIPNLKSLKTILYIGVWPDRFQFETQLKKIGYDITIIEAFYPYVAQSRARGYEAFHSDICEFTTDREWDVVMWWHGPEHIEKKILPQTLKSLEKMANNYVVLGVPWGKYSQGNKDDNKWMIHKATLFPNDFLELGYKVETLGKENKRGSNLLAWENTNDKS